MELDELKTVINEVKGIAETLSDIVTTKEAIVSELEDDLSDMTRQYNSCIDDFITLVRIVNPGIQEKGFSYEITTNKTLLVNDIYEFKLVQI